MSLITLMNHLFLYINNITLIFYNISFLKETTTNQTFSRIKTWKSAAKTGTHIKRRGKQSETFGQFQTKRCNLLPKVETQTFSGWNPCFHLFLIRTQVYHNPYHLIKLKDHYLYPFIRMYSGMLSLSGKSCMLHHLKCLIWCGNGAVWYYDAGLPWLSQIIYGISSKYKHISGSSSSGLVHWAEDD